MVRPAGSVMPDAALTLAEKTGPRMALEPSRMASLAAAWALAAWPAVSLMTIWIVSLPKSCMASSAPLRNSAATAAPLPGAVLGRSIETRTAPVPTTSPLGLGVGVADELGGTSGVLLTPRLADWQAARPSAAPISTTAARIDAAAHHTPARRTTLAISQVPNRIVPSFTAHAGILFAGAARYQRLAPIVKASLPFVHRQSCRQNRPDEQQ